EGPSGINPGFPGLSRCRGQVIHVILTRSPLSPGPKSWFSLDLHVLSAPPAFVLSQDQTLREEIMRRQCRQSDPFFELSKSSIRLPKEKKTGSFPLAGLRPRGVSTFHAVEFSKTTPTLAGLALRPTKSL